MSRDSSATRLMSELNLGDVDAASSDGVILRSWSASALGDTSSMQLVDLSSHNANPPGVFDGEPVPLSDVADTRIAESVAALREIVAKHEWTKQK